MTKPRTCKYPNCITILNSYHKDDYCHVHGSRAKRELEEEREAKKQNTATTYQKRYRDEKKLP